MQNPTPMPVNERLKGCRTVMGQTQQQVADACGLDRSFYTKIELGTMEVRTPETAIALAKHFREYGGPTAAELLKVDSY